LTPCRTEAWIREEASEDIIVWMRVFESKGVVNESEFEGRKEEEERRGEKEN